MILDIYLSHIPKNKHFEIFDTAYYWNMWASDKEFELNRKYSSNFKFYD